MPLQPGDVQGYDFDRMVVDFTMLNQGNVRCAISTAAMDDLEGTRDVKAERRVDQFARLRDAIEERASRKFFEGPGHCAGGLAIERFLQIAVPATFVPSRKRPGKPGHSQKLDRSERQAAAMVG